MSNTIKFEHLPEFVQTAFVTSGIKQSASFFRDLGIFLDRETQLVFKSVRASGGSDQQVYNRTTWKGYSASTLHPLDYKGFPDQSRWRGRTGTDGSKGKYSANSLMNLKSGQYARSWRPLTFTDHSLLFGSNYHSEKGADLAHILAAQRPVINYDNKMKSDFSTLWRGWMDKQIKGSLNTTT